jgi:hypothetical protein
MSQDDPAKSVTAPTWGVRQWLRWAAKYITDFSRWFLASQYIVVVVVALLVVALPVIFSACLERQIRFSGMLIQLVGVFIVVLGLRDARRAFEDQPTTWQSIKQWWAGRPRFGPRHHVLSAAGISLGISSGAARARVSPGRDASLDQRVKLLEQQYASLSDEVDTLSAETKQRTDELSKALEAERREREDSDNRAKEQLRTAIAEGIPLEFLGAVFVLFGIVADSASPEIASLFGKGACGS